jgi:hypothetical protein
MNIQNILLEDQRLWLFLPISETNAVYFAVTNGLQSPAYYALYFAVTIFRALEVTVKMEARKMKLRYRVFHKSPVSLPWTR